MNREIPLSSSFLSQNFGLSEEEENIIQYTEENLNKIKSFVEDVTILIEKIHHDEYKYQQIASISKRMFILLQKQKQTLTVMQRDQELLTKVCLFRSSAIPSLTNPLRLRLRLWTRTSRPSNNVSVTNPSMLFYMFIFQ